MEGAPKGYLLEDETVFSLRRKSISHSFNLSWLRC